jgi:RHS repeat-associated protein
MALQIKKTNNYNGGRITTGWENTKLYVSPDTDYVITGYYRCVNSNSIPRVVVRYFDSSGNVILNTPTDYTYSADWTKFTLTSNVPVNAAWMMIRLLDSSAQIGAEVYFDNIKLKVPGLDGSVSYDYTGKKEDAGTGLKYFGARFYDPEVGRFLTIDPKKDRQNWFIYCGDNPLNRIDPDGQDYILLNMVWAGAAFGFGHNACLVGNDLDGWTYYSKDGSKAGNVTKSFENFEEFQKSKFADKYDRAYRVSTTREQDKKMKDYGDKNYKKSYSVWEEKEKGATTNKKENCADLTAGVGKAGGAVDISQPKSLGLNITIPNTQYDEFTISNEGQSVSPNDDSSSNDDYDDSYESY